MAELNATIKRAQKAITKQNDLGKKYTQEILSLTNDKKEVIKHPTNGLLQAACESIQISKQKGHKKSQIIVNKDLDIELVSANIEPIEVPIIENKNVLTSTSMMPETSNMELLKEILDVLPSKKQVEVTLKPEVTIEPEVEV